MISLPILKELSFLRSEVQRLRGIIERNCDPGQAKVLSSDKGDAVAIQEIIDAADKRDSFAVMD